jgi:predicted acylesterase/phospholipase RssA
MIKPLPQPTIREMKALDPLDRPPLDRFCDVVLDGGVINGVVYPGFLIEIARKFRFRSLGGTSVGAIAAALAAACEYNRRFGSDNGFNEGLAKMPGELADWIDESKQITRIRSLFQPHKDVKPLFDYLVDVLGMQQKLKNDAFADEQKAQTGNTKYVPSPAPRLTLGLLRDIWIKAVQHLGPNLFDVFWWGWLAIFLTWVVYPQAQWMRVLFAESLFLTGILLAHPLGKFCCQFIKLMRLPGSGACTGMRVEGSAAEGLSEWLHEGLQKSANLELHQPLTFRNLWDAPGSPMGWNGRKEPRSIDLRMVTTCLSHGRIYELPLGQDDPVLMFKLSELEPYFPKAVITHLRRVSKPVRVSTCALLQRKFNERSISYTAGSPQQLQALLDACKLSLDKAFQKAENPEKGLNDPDIRELPTADLPIVVAARLSMSCPVLFQNIPMIGFNLDKNAEDIDLVRLWFSDGGIGSNFPIHLFDKPIPRWPTFGLKILDDPPRKTSSGYPLKSYLPYGHMDGADDNLLFPRDIGAFTSLFPNQTVSSFIKFLFSIYTSAKDGHDQSFLRMPEVRNRVVRIYMNNRAGNMLNLKIEPEQIVALALEVGAPGGRNAAQAYLAQVANSKYTDWVNTWQDHRWVRFNMLTHGLRSYLKGFSQAVNASGLPGSTNCNTLIDQIDEATQNPPLRSMADPSDQITLTPAQSNQLKDIVRAISELENQLQAMDLPQPYMPEPMPVLRFKPQY